MLTVTILTKNSQKYLKEVLCALEVFQEVLIYDTGSTDETLNIAKTFSNVKIYQSPFEGFGPTHNKASSCATYDWILSVDSDEVVTKELAEEIKALQLDPSCVYSMPRHNYYKGKWIKGCGWYPDRQIRLYNRVRTKFTEEQVHEKIISENMQQVPLKSPLKHYSYASTSDFLNKMQHYSDLFAKQNKDSKRSSVSKAILHGFFAFFKSYFLKRGLLDGKQGFEISVYNGNTAFYKYLKLSEANKKSCI